MALKTGPLPSFRNALVTVIRFVLPGAALFAWLATGRLALGEGVFLPSIGPVNQSIGGAATACPIDSAGALAWNPASISGLRSSEVTFGLGSVLPTTSIASSVGGASGSTNSEPGVCPVPTIGFVSRSQSSPWTLGLGIYGIGGFSSNYPASTTNPILAPQSLGGLGRIHTKAEIYQVAPTVSYAVTDKFSLGVAPTLTMANLSVDPLFLAPPSPTYGSGNGSRMSWGGGFQLGGYYITDVGWQFGLSYKSPQWLEAFRFNSETGAGLPTFQEFNFDLPSITSLGAAYSGFERLLLTTDFRYFDFANADGFRQSGFRPDGAVAGLGWRNICSVTSGVQYEFTPRLTLRTGYSFNQNPIVGSQAMFNVGSPLIIQHWYSIGATFRWSSRVSSTIAYTHGFENTVTGPVVQPAGPVPGSSVTNRVSADILNAGFTVNY